MTLRSINKLTPRDIAALGDGQHSDGGGLYLFVRDNGRLRSWILRYSVNRKLTVMGLGALAAVPLKVARQKRDKLRAQLDEGLDPLAERRKRRAEQDAKRTFGEVAKLTLAKKAGGWKGGASSTSYAAWARTLDREAKALHSRPVDEIGVDEIKRVVAPLWEAGLKTAKRPRKGGLSAARLSLARIAAVFDAAKAHGWRTADNPAAWSIFRHILPERPKTAKHHPMVEWRDAPEIMARLRHSASMSALCLEFAILTGTRIGETLHAEWQEFDFERALWTIPALRTKRSVEHAVPLSQRSMAILTALRERRQAHGSKVVFRGGLDGRRGAINRGTIWDQAQRVSDGKASTHGWRATLRSWMADHAVPFEVAEACLAHTSASVVQAYQRSTLLERRRPVMEQWAQFLSGEEPATAEVIPMRRA